MPVFGCVSPSIVHLPWDVADLLPPGVCAIVATLNVRNGRPGEAERAETAIAGAIDVLADEGARAIVVQGVPNAARRGLDGDRRLLGEHGERRGLAIASSLDVSALALRELRAQRPLVVTQYDDAMNGQVVDYLRASGVEPRAVRGLGCRNAAEVNAKSAADYERLARETLAAYPDADAIFLAARANLFEVAQRLEREREIPVVEQAQATVWWSLAQLGVRPPAERGRLLSSSPALSAGVV